MPNRFDGGRTTPQDAAGVSRGPRKDGLVVPDGVIVLPDTEIGGKIKSDLISDFLDTKKVGTGEHPFSIIYSSGFRTLHEPKTITPVIASPSAMGLTDLPTTEQIFARAKELGWDCCQQRQLSTGQWMQVQYKPYKI
jgi:hypothetical protein